MSRKIRKVAVLGSGVMGSGIAAHFANIGLDVLLLDIVPFDITDEERKSKAQRNRIVNGALKAASKAKLNPFYEKSNISRITTGNFDDDFEKIADCDWIIEVVVERLDIKKQIFDKVEKYRKPGSLITSNTSGIPIYMMAEGRSEDFVKHFCGTHFFNPPRYLRLLEIIPTKKTSQEVVDFFMNYGDKYLGKRTVLCKDTPAFIANRVGVYAMAKVFQLTEKLGLTIEAVDKLTGPLIGRPKTGTFRLGDLVGHDTSVKVIKGIKDNCPNDEQAGAFELPKYMEFLIENKFLGNKSKKGFYETVRGKDGSKTVYALDLEKLEYVEKRKVRLASIGAAKGIEDLGDRVRAMFDAEDEGGQLVRGSLLGLFAYVSNRIPEISDDLYSIDDALKAGFAWEVGAFEYWDMIGLEKGIKLCEEAGYTIGQWVKDMLGAGHTSFYKTENGLPHYYDITAGAYKAMPGAGDFIILDNTRASSVIWKNAGCAIHDMGDGVLCCEFRSKMNSIGADVLEGINKAIDMAEAEGWKGVVIGNNATNFSVGANLAMIGMMAYGGQTDDLNTAIATFQNTTMRCRYSSIPVVAATQGFVFGGGCETMMHCDTAIVSAESYIGLVEVGVGLIPGGGGTKEFALRASDSFFEGDVQIPTLVEKFKTIALASVATSGYDAFKKGYLVEGYDRISVNTSRTLAEAKKEVLALADNYTQPIERNDIYVLGRTGLAALYTAAASLRFGNYASEHDIKIARKIAYVLCGGDLSSPQKVTERYLLDIEREAFLSLVTEPKTLERISHMLSTNKPLRN